MRINPSVAATVARTSETSSTATAKPTVASKANPELKTVGHSIVDGGCFPPPRPLPTPLPPISLPPITLPPIFKPADAQVRGKQGDQLHEIANDVRNGSVTAKESEQLLKEQQDIAKATQSAMADGKLSMEEQLKLNVMQARAELHIYQAGHNSSRELLAGFDSGAQRQAGQIDRLADGRTNGSITNTEATELLGQQEQVSEARTQAGGLFGRFLLDNKLNQADKELTYHSRPGTQFHFEPFPHPVPLPLPKPLPFPELPRPLPFPRPDVLPAKPSFEMPTFLKGAIAG
ncbi:MAG: hypothetical protein ACJ8AT_04385 [Hyalangium sp.]|uniref:hypothetical protein n=1 Tax=Hyalangium sp. TaxID=2028555 RepID=UPI00389B347A